MEKLLAHQVALIAGTSPGNGYSLAQALTNSGAAVGWARRMLNHHRIQTLIRKEITSCLTFSAGFLASR
ncbi:hypothetical protein [Paraburkholderia phytofirmans]|uniref:hypothetical protein n=1 Tax=Paraburkholderia phytofirmans TaxID=261302 RepID=UPI0013966BCF|nr:hypothetical protein [Paraburkholderia phytofirmans]